ncbi:MAG: PP2C family protein-serine/threonine phosphatase [Motilibacteraceae bacterium]
MAQPGPPPDRFLADASRALASTLNLRRTLARVLDLAVPALGTDAALLLATSRGWELHDGRRRSPAPDQVGAMLDAVDGLRAAHRLQLPADVVARLGLVPDRPAAQHELTVLPLHARGFGIGHLLLLDATVPGERPSPDQTTGTAFAELAALALANARLFAERGQLVETLRGALLQPALPEVPGVRLGAAYRPAQEATEIGGDFYDVFPVEQDRWAFALGDVCGKGVGAAVLTGRFRQSLRTAALVHEAPDQVLHLVNRAMLGSSGRTFATIVHGSVRVPAPGLVQVELAAGGHPPPLVLRADGRVEPVELAGTIVGILPRARFATATVALRAGDSLVLHTDGLTEAARRTPGDPAAPAGEGQGPEAVGELGTGARFGEERLRRLVADCTGMPAQAVADRLAQAALEHVDGRSHDDLAVLVLQPRPEDAP